MSRSASSSSSRQEIVIVGGGIMGVCSAYFLTQSQDYKEGRVGVTVVEEGDIACGASGQAAGFLAKDWHGPATASLSALSYNLYAQLAKEHNGKDRFGYRLVNAYSVDIKPPSRRNKGNVTAQEASASEIAPPTRELPHEAHWLSLPPGREAGQALSWLDKEAIDVIQQLGDEGTTAQLHPRQFVETMWAECLKRGAKLFKGRAVKATKQGGHVQSLTVSTPQGDQHLSLNKLLITAGPWTGSVARNLISADVPVYELPGHSIIYKPTQALEAEAMFARILDKDATNGPELFTRPDGTIYIAGQNTGAPLPPGGVADSQQWEPDLEKLRKAMAILSPNLINGHIVKTQLCYRPVTKNGTPFVSPIPSTDNVWCCAGSGPWGILQGPGCGKVMSELLLGKKPSADISQLSLDGAAAPRAHL